MHTVGSNSVMQWHHITEMQNLHVHCTKLSPLDYNIILTWKYLLWKPTDIEEPSDECNDVHHSDLGHEELERNSLNQVWKAVFPPGNFFK